ncbi:type III-A CRISPR-associated RAMP protein Csm3 [Nitratifractor sp.]
MKILKLRGEIELLSGLHIGGGDDTMKIGGIDNQVIKDPNTDRPYIPGSSLKGKMRSLLEWHLGFVGIGDGSPFGSGLLEDPLFADEEKKRAAENFLRLFGDPNPESPYGITRISVGDCRLSPDSEGMVLSEAKYENMIDRQKGTAQHPRQTERVPAGVRFVYDIRVKVLEGDDEEALKALVSKGLELVEADYLGGNGSRGYGRVRFGNKTDWTE